MADVVVLGNVGVDTHVYGAHQASGLESRFTRNHDYIGQAGGYCARGFRRLGHDTSLIAHVGDDPWGHFIVETLAAEGIGLDGLWLDPTGTARSINIMAEDGGRINYYDGKGHMTQEPPLDVCRRILQGGGLAHFHLANWTRQLLQTAGESGRLISCDLQDVVDSDDPYRRDFIEAADILFFSAANFDDPKLYIESCFQCSPARLIVAGLGARGALLADRKHIEHFPTISMERPVVDTNGAGDALAVGFLDAHVFKGLTPRESMNYALVNARYTCSLADGSNSLITPERQARLLEAPR